MIPFLLVILGLILIFIEFYIPGGVMGVLGGGAIIAGILLFASQSTSLVATILFVIGTAVAIGLLIRFALWRIVHSKGRSSIYSDHDQEGYQASSYDHTVIGKTGTVLSDLKPGGFIIVEGKQHPAISVSGYISKGEEVVIIKGEEQSVLVKKKTKGT